MVCPECGSTVLEYITNDFIKCECGYADECCMFETRYQRKANRSAPSGRFDDEENDGPDQDS